MNYLSLFSGIEAATQAWHTLGWTCKGVADIDPFACSYLAERYPNVPNLGSVTGLTEADIERLGALDLVVGGSPCQDLSLAGLRKGLAGARSGLFYDQIRIFNYARERCGARWLVWENVPGAFSSQKGADFAEVVGAMAGCQDLRTPKNGWGSEGCAIGDNGLVEWCVLDAQWFGVAQRRRRVFAVLDTGNWADRPPVLLERHSLRGDSAPSREARENTSTSANTGSQRGYPVGEPDISQCLTKGTGQRYDPETETETILAFHVNAQPDEINFSTDTTAALTKSQSAGVCYGIQANIIDRLPHNGGNGLGVSSELCPTQTKVDRHAVCYTASIDYEHNGAPIGAPMRGSQSGGRKPLPSVSTSDMKVRRLTPKECERLHGFPDEATLIHHRGKLAKDAPRYAALGNSMAVPVMAWIGKQIAIAELF